jgi:F420-non-reducing hydrogenase iron-sulfur subunit
VEYTKELLREIGLEPDRLEMFHIGASDAPAWARAVIAMTERAKKFGPNPLKKSIADPAIGKGLPISE